MKKILLLFIGIVFSLTNFLYATAIDSLMHQHLVREGQKQLCRLFDINDEAIEKGKLQEMQFVVFIDNEAAVNYDISQATAGHAPSPATQSPEADTLNARIRRIYQQYDVELYLIYINSLDIIIHSPIPDNINYQQLFTQKLYDDATNMAALRQEHEQLSKDIIENNISARQRDCIILSTGDYCGTFSHDGGKESHWQFSKEFIHHSTTATFPELTSLYSDFGARLMSDNNFRHGGINVSAEGAVDEFAKAAKYAKLRASLMNVYTREEVKEILDGFTYPTDFTALTVEQRRHVISVFAGFPMGQSTMLWKGEQELVIEVIATVPKTQIEGVVYFLSQPSYLHGNPLYSGNAGSSSLITMIVNNTFDSFLLLGEDDYKELMKTLTQMIASDQDVFSNHLPTTNEGWHNRQIMWGNDKVCPPIGTQRYDVVLQDNGKVQVARKIVSAWNRSHFNAQSGEWTYTPAWTTDTTFELNPFDIVFFKNQSELGMVEAAGAPSGQISVVPAIFLQYAADKSFNSALLSTAALALDVIALATGPGAIIGAIEVGNTAVAAFEALQFIGAAGNILANGITDPDLRSLVDEYNMIVGIWGFSHLATSIGKFSVNYFTEVKLGEVQAIPVGTANDFNSKYALTESKLSELPEAEQMQVEKMEEYFKEEGVQGPIVNEEIPFINGWTKESILALPKGQRPNPSTYLSQSYINNQLSKFENGASYLVPKTSLDNYGRVLIGRPDGQFVMSKLDMDNLLSKANGSLSVIETELGIPSGVWENKELVRIDIQNPAALNERLPSGNESGANELWIPGGKLPTGYSEAVINQIPQGSYTETLTNIR